MVLLGSIASPKYVGVLGDDLRRAPAVSRRFRRTRRHEPRRSPAAEGQRGRRARLRAGRRRRQARPAAAEAPAQASKLMALTIPSRRGQRRPERGREGRPPHQPPQAVLAGARADQGRSAAVLRVGRRRAAAARPRSRDGHEALPARRVGRLLLHEARADAASRVDRDVRRSITAPARSSTSR